MAKSRREFLKIAGVSGMVLCLPATVGLVSAIAHRAPHHRPEGAPPAPKGKRWAMAVDIGKCRADCFDCVAACHSRHNVPDFEQPKHDINWITVRPFPDVLPGIAPPRPAPGAPGLALPILCCHCDNPPCVRVCPVGATFKRADGITMMDYHRCIGCRFCMAACPYGSRSMNYRDPRPFIRKINLEFPTRMAGVVEKCHFCEDRLARGLMPACVEACRQKALLFGDVRNRESEFRRVLDGRFSLRRKPELGTEPQIYYLL